MVLIVAEMIEQLTTYKSYVWQIDTDTVVILEHGALRVTWFSSSIQVLWHDMVKLVMLTLIVVLVRTYNIWLLC